MKKFLLVSFVLASVAFSEPARAEEGMAESKATASVELLGAGFLYSVFGSYKFVPQVAANLGVSYVSVSSGGTGSSNLVIPVSISFLAGGAGNSYFEVLGGGSIYFGSNTAPSTSSFKSSLDGWVTTLGAGYRYWPKEGGLHFRATMYGFIKGGFFPWFGLSFGYAFS